MLLRERGEIKVVPFDALKDEPVNSAENAQALSAANVASIVPKIQSGENPKDVSKTDDSVPF